ncbi:MAG: hypothetical protein ACKOC5_14580 [Chloroflexota bacterium]
MTMPALLLGFVLSTLYGAAFHAWRGGSAGRLLLDLLLAWLGFWAGNYLAGLVGLSVLKIGALHAGAATLFSLGFLLVGHWLSLTPQKT